MLFGILKERYYINVMENQNSVCFVARIGEVKPIEGADNIEL